MAEEELMHYGIKGMRWGVRGSFETTTTGFAPPSKTKVVKPKTAATPRAKATPPVAKVKSQATVAKSAPKAPTNPAPSRSFQPSGPKALPSRSFQSATGKPSAPAPSRMSGAVSTKRKDNWDAAERAHHRKMVLLGVGVVGAVGVVAVGATAYKVAPGAGRALVRGGEKAGLAAGVGAGRLRTNPRVAAGLVKGERALLRGEKAASKARLNAAFKSAEIAESASKNKALIGANAALNRNSSVARGGIQNSLSELRQDTAQVKAMNDAEDYIKRMVQNRAAGKPPIGDQVRKSARAGAKQTYDRTKAAGKPLGWAPPGGWPKK